MSRSKRRKLWREGGEARLPTYQKAVLALRSMASLHYLPLGARATGNAPNDLMRAWALIWRAA